PTRERYGLSLRTIVMWRAIEREAGHRMLPIQKRQKDLGRGAAVDTPVLMLLRQHGTEGRGWRGLPFWWPVIMTPDRGTTAIFAMDEALAPTALTSTGPMRALETEELP